MNARYSLADIALMSGITERTLRKRLAEGAILGEKQGGKWMFTQEAVGNFLDRPDIRDLCSARRRACAEDFLNARIKGTPSCLCVVDMPGAGKEFLDQVLSACAGVTMFYTCDDRAGMTRVTLTGEPARVSAVLRTLIPDKP